MKTCTKCSVEQEETNFAKKGSGLQVTCRGCQSLIHKDWYAKNKENRKQQIYKRNKELQKQFEPMIRKLKSVPCTDCNKTYHHCQMQFDHLRDKKFGISQSIREGVAIKTLMEEIAKCEVVCANCHCLRTHNRRKYGGYSLNSKALDCDSR